MKKSILIFTIGTIFGVLLMFAYSYIHEIGVKNNPHSETNLQNNARDSAENVAVNLQSNGYWLIAHAYIVRHGGDRNKKDALTFFKEAEELKKRNQLDSAKQKYAWAKEYEEYSRRTYEESEEEYKKGCNLLDSSKKILIQFADKD